MVFDTIIDDIQLVDGTGNKRFPAALGVKGKKISAVAQKGELKDGEKIISGGGKLLSPGFIDIHSHDDLIFWQDPYNMPKLFQGVTTVVTGMCGFSPFPLPEDKKRRQEFTRIRAIRGEGYPWTASDLFSYQKELKELKIGLNVVPFVGHGPLRNSILGFSPKKPDEKELLSMELLLEKAMIDGAFGLSTGLIYPPGAYSDTREIIALAKILSKYEGLYFSHIRSESETMPQALEEAITIGREAGVPIHIGHFKCLGKKSWGKAQERLAILDKAYTEGFPNSWDQYPYNANSTSLLSLLPPDTQEEGIEKLLINLGKKEYRSKLKDRIKKEEIWENFFLHAGWEGIMLSEVPGWEELEGKKVGQLISENKGNDPFELVFDALQASSCSATMITFTMSPGDLRTIVEHPRTAIGSDGMAGKGKEHPRMYGTFPRVFRKYVNEEKNLSVEEAIRKMTSLPAEILGLKDRGIIKEGAFADLIIFDHEHFCDSATYEEPRQLAKGVQMIMVNGELVLEEGGLTKKRPGNVLKPKK